MTKEPDIHSGDNSVLQDSSITDLTLQLEHFKFKEMDENKTNSNVPASQIQHLASRYSIAKDEIEDFIDENPINMTIINVDDIDTCIQTIINLRTEFRVIFNEISIQVQNLQLDDVYSKESQLILSCIKEYIIHAKERKSEIRQSEKDHAFAEKSIKIKKDTEEYTQKHQAAKFLINEVSRITKELHEEFSKDSDGQVLDEEISRRKEDLPSNLTKLDLLSTKFQRCLEIIPDGYENKNIIPEMTQNYENLVEEKNSMKHLLIQNLEREKYRKKKHFKFHH